MQGAFGFAVVAHNGHVLRLFDRWFNGQKFDWLLSYNNDQQLRGFVMNMIQERKVTVLDFGAADFAVEDIGSICSDIKAMSGVGSVPMVWLDVDVLLRSIGQDHAARLDMEYALSGHIDKLRYYYDGKYFSLLLVNREADFKPHTKDLSSRLSSFCQEELRYVPYL